MRAYDVCTVYSDDKIRFPQLRIKCGVAKSCPGTHAHSSAGTYGQGEFEEQQISI